MAVGVEFQTIGDDGRLSRDPEAERLLDDLLDRDDSGVLSPSAYLAELADIVAKYPDYIDGHVHLGNALFESGKPKGALTAYQRGVELGETAIPADYAGTLSWYEFSNRPFLRALHGAALAQLRLNKRKLALPMLERLLALNPDDALGIRYLLGPEYLRAGEREKARFFLESWAGEYPPCGYDLGLLLIGQGKYIAAATALRLAFAANHYIAEMLCGHPDPAPLTIWHGSNFATPGLAHDYVEHYGRLWRDTPDALSFLQWLYHHSKVTAERAALLECREELLWEQEFETRQRLVERERAVLDEIDDRMSEQIVRKRVNRNGQERLPWRDL